MRHIFCALQNIFTVFLIFNKGHHEEMPKKIGYSCLLAWLYLFDVFRVACFLKDKSRLSTLEVSFASHCLALALISSACFQSVSQYSGPLTVHCNTPYRSPVSEPNPSEEEEAPNVVHAPPDL